MLRNDARTTRRGFTLVEMLVVVTVLGLLSGMVLVALAGAAETAREARTRSQIQKLNEFIMTRYESYRTRRTPRPSMSAADLARFDLPIADGEYSPRELQGARVENIRGLMIQEMPDRKSDLAAFYGSMATGTYTSTYARHQRAILAIFGLSPNAANWATAYSSWTEENQHSECLYLVLASISDGETSALEFLHDSEIGDTDGDGVPEVLDGWGNPIAFIRWPHGYIGFESSLQDIRVYDTFDPLRTRTSKVPTSTRPMYHPSEPNTSDPSTFLQFNLIPLIVSPGKDGIFDIVGDDSATTGVIDTAHGITASSGTGPISYSTNPTLNPYVFTAAPFVGANGSVGVGAVNDVNGDGYDNSVDNISNHYLIVGGNSP